MGGVLSPEAGDVLLNSTGTGTIGRSVVFTYPGRFVVDGHVTLLRPRSVKADGRWLNSILRTSWGQNFLETQCYSGSTNQVELSRTRLAAAKIPTPPLLEQRRIAAILDTLDEAIRKTEQLIVKLKQVKQGLLHDLLTRGIDDNGELRDPIRHPEQFKNSPSGFLPKTWRGGILGDFIDGSPQNGLYKPANFYADEGMPIIRIDSFHEGIIKNATQLKRVQLTAQERGLYSVRTGDLLINRVNSIDYIGKAAMIADAPDTVVFESNIMRLRLRLTDVLPAYAILILCSPSCRAYFQSRAKHAIAQVSVNQDDVREVPFSVPSLAEQTAIVIRAQAFAQRIDCEQAELSKLRLLKQGLMEDLLTGRVRVTNLLGNENAP